MKIAYLLSIDVKKYTGILIKVKSQVNEWIKQGYTVEIFLITNDIYDSINNSPLSELLNHGKVKLYISKKLGFIPIDLVKDFFSLESIFSLVSEDLDAYDPDVIYTRNTLFQPFLKKVGSNSKLILEFNTDMESEYKLQAFDSSKYFFRYLYFLTTNSFLLKRVSGVVCVTYEISKKIKITNNKVFPNSIDVGDYNLKFNSSVNKRKRIVFIGTSKMTWHGVDILVELAKKIPTVDFDIIGIEKKEFKNSTNNVFFHGYLTKEEYLTIFEKATAAIASLAFFRNNMDEACPLKVREYLACCKPVILPYKDTAFEKNGYPEWALQLENSKEGILNSVNKIEKFLSVCENFKITQNDVKKYVDSETIEKERLSFFEDIVKSY